MTPGPETTIGGAPPGLVRDALAAGRLVIDYGTARVQVRSPLRALASQIETVYRAFPFRDAEPFADLHVEVIRGQGLRRFVRTQSRFRIDGIVPFDPYPAESAFPHFEWGVNWCFARRFNQYVLLHAAVLARGSRSVVMAAVPGAGKSTLCAALMQSGWRLLSDEFGVLSPGDGSFRAMLKPVALKNRSIDVIRDHFPGAPIGPTFPGTRKGDVAHLSPDAASIRDRHLAARPALVVFPRYVEGGQLRPVPIPPENAFSRLAFNSFNYAVLGEKSFHAVADVVTQCPAFDLQYGTLRDAIDCLGDLFDPSAEAPAT